MLTSLTFLTILGFLGLIGIIILILIYVLKPNYQQKSISSTYVWKLSLKYKRRRIPISKLRNLLIILCQILMIIIGAFILSQPFLIGQAEDMGVERILIIDASASMQAVYDGTTRFDRAIDLARAEGLSTLSQEGGLVTLIIAGRTATAPALRTNSVDVFNAAIYSAQSTFGTADIDRAMTIAEDILEYNPGAVVILYTATEFVDTGNVEIVNVANNEWNAAILNARAIFGGIINPDTSVLDWENQYIFEVEAASFNRDTDLSIILDIDDAVYALSDGDYWIEHGPVRIRMQMTAQARDNEVMTLHFMDERMILSFSSAHIFIDDADDAFSYDNDFWIFGGERQQINVLYVSSIPDGPVAGQNRFFQGVLSSLRTLFSFRWDIVVTETTLALMEDEEFYGYDLYIFEHMMPDVLPTDGVVLLADLDIAPENSGLVLGERQSRLREDGNIGDEDFFVLQGGESSNIMSWVNPNRIRVSEYALIVSHEGFTPLMFYEDDPVFLVRNDREARIAAFAFSGRFSNITLTIDWSILMYNLFQYFFPPTVNQFVFDVDEIIVFDARGTVINVDGPMLSSVFDSFPFVLSSSRHGVFEIRQQLLRVDGTGMPIEITERFFVRINREESNFLRVETFRPPFVEPPPAMDLDLLIYFALMLVVLAFCERLLRIKDETI